MPDNNKIREARDRLAAIAPVPGDCPSAAELAKWLAVQAQLGWAANVDPGNPAVPLGMSEFRLLCAQFAACHALEALRERDPGHADQVAAEIGNAWMYAPGVGEWVWEHLGDDAREVAGIAGELAALATAPAKAVPALAICAGCGSKRALSPDGTVAFHEVTVMDADRVLDECPGTGKPPAGTGEAGALTAPAAEAVSAK